MKKHILFIVLITLLLSSGKTSAQTVINSLTELQSHLNDSDGNFKMTPGTYYFNTENCGEGKLFSDPNLLFFTGSNCIFDFTGVKFEYDTEIFTQFGNIDILEFWPVGDENIYKNLTMEDIGMTVPSKGASSIHLDGYNNRIEGFKTTVRGSFPYGYGDMFGKGGATVITKYKHAGILVRGEYNHLLNCTVIMRAYGHGIFVQGSDHAKIEGCYIEGELRTVGDVLQEEGTDSPADIVDFETVWGFNLKDLEYDYTFSLQEAGIRAYSTGVNHGETESRATSNTTVIDCTIVKMRVGVNTGAEGGDEKLIENCTALACEVGFWLGYDGNVVDCRGDASVGPLFSEDIGRSGATYELTLLDNYIPKIGNEPYLYFAGTNHNFTLHDGTTYYNPDIEIQVGGIRQAHRWLTGSPSEPMQRKADGITLTNNTNYPLILNSNVSNSTFYSCGPVTDKGSGNTISQASNCATIELCNNTASNLEAECYDTMSGITTRDIDGTTNEKEIYNLKSGDWIHYDAINLTNVVSVEVIASSVKDDVNMEIRQGSISGTLLATVPISSTTDYSIYQTFSADLNHVVSGDTDLYFVFTSSTQTEWLFNLDKINFISDACSTASYNPFLPIPAENFCDSSGITVDDVSIFNKIIEDVNNEDYLKFSNVDFGYDHEYNAIDIFASSATEGGTIEVRSGSLDGTLLATVEVKNTGSWDNYEVFSGYSSTIIEGTLDIYLVFKGSSGFLLNIDNFYFNYDTCFGVDYDAYDQIDALDYCEMYGVVPINNAYLGGINDGDWIHYGSMDFTSIAPPQVTFNVAGYPTEDTIENGYINVMLDHPEDGSMIARVTVPKTGGWEVWKEVTTSLLQDITGEHEVYLYFGNGAFNLDWLEFHQEIIELDNLALATNGGVASQSTTAYGGVSSRAIDGNSNGDFGSDSVTHTENGVDGILKWWQVDLGEDKIIRDIVIYNRTGSNYGESLNNFTVEIINDNGNITFSQTFSEYPNPSIKIDTDGSEGKIVKISKTSNRGITLAEVEVFGTSTLSINHHLLLNEIKLFPNPATNIITIKNAADSTLELYDMHGILELKLQISEDEKQINIENLSSGLYFLTFKNKQRVIVKKLIKK